MRFLFFLILPLSAILHSCSRPGPVNYIGDVNAVDSEIFVRNWEITRPVIMDSSSEADASSACRDTLNRDQGDNITSYADFCSVYDEPASDTNLSAYTPFVKYPYRLNTSYFFVNNYYQIPERPSFLYPVIPALVYTASVINSDRDQDVIFIAGANNGLKIWLNGQLILRKFTTGFVQGYQYVARVHIKKGNNFLLARLNHVTGDWKFFLKIASLQYANETSVGDNYSSICKHYLIRTGDSLALQLWVPEIIVKKTPLLRITGLNGAEVLQHRLSPATDRVWKVDIGRLKEGPYAVTLTTDEQSFRQYIFYGDHEKYFHSFRSSIEHASSSPGFKENISLLIDRMGYIDTVKVEHDNEYERKVSWVLYEMSDMYRQLKKGDQQFTDRPGLHLRSLSSPSYASDTYMIYVPDTYHRSTPIPLVMMLPHETGIREFTISTYVSDINRIEHVMRLADKYGFAVVWSSYRVYNNHNLTRMFPALVARTLQSVKKDYAIDDNRIYAYGDCGGGELALFMANRFPSFFAAVGVEGPAIPDTSITEGVQSLMMGQNSYNLYNTGINYRNFPTLIIHSINDEKCPFERSAQLYKEISQLGANTRLDTLYIRKGTDLFFSDLMPNYRILNDLFSFYSGHRRRIPDTVWLSTWQLKYNRAFWLAIDDLVPGEKATITAIANRTGHSIHVQCSNVTAFTLDTRTLGLDTTRRTEVFVNNQSRYNDLVRGGKLTIDLRTAATPPSARNELTEGPINDFFSAPFLVVRATKADAGQKIKWQHAFDTLRKGWQIDFMRDAIPCKTDREIKKSDLDNYNLVLIGADSSTPVLHRIWQHIPLKVSGDTITIGRKTYTGKELSYVLIYPNPLNKDRYVLLIGSNYSRISSKVLVDHTYDGWGDYEIYDNDTRLDAGYFNNNWQ